MSADLTIYLLWIVWVISWIAAAFWAAPNHKHADWKREIPSRLVTVFGVILLFGIYSPHYIGLARLWRIEGGQAWILTLLAAAGFAFTWWARIHLGTLWSSSVTCKAEHRVVESGPYRLVRHPIYSGLLLAAFATAIEIGTIVALAGAALMAVGCYLKARLEEEFLRTELGADAYARYAAKTAMLVPLVRL